MLDHVQECDEKQAKLPKWIREKNEKQQKIIEEEDEILLSTKLLEMLHSIPQTSLAERAFNRYQGSKKDCPVRPRQFILKCRKSAMKLRKLQMLG